MGVDPVLLEHFPADVDLQGGVRRVGPHDRAPQVLLSQAVFDRAELLPPRRLRAPMASESRQRAARQCGLVAWTLVQGSSIAAGTRAWCQRRFSVARRRKK